MDSQTADLISKSFLPINYQNVREPKEYFRYYVSELIPKVVAAGTFPSSSLNDNQFGVIKQDTPICPNTCMGLVEARREEGCLYEIGVLLSHSMVVVPLVLEGDWKIDFYTCFNTNKYYNKVPIRSVFSNKRQGYAVLILEEPVSHITGAAEFNYQFHQNRVEAEQTAPERQMRQNRGRGGRGKGGRGRGRGGGKGGMRRDRRLVGQRLQVWRFVQANGAVVRELTEVALEEIGDISQEGNMQGVCFQLGRQESFTFVGIFKRGRLAVIKHEDLVSLMRHEESMLICGNLYISKQEIQFMGSKKWNKLVRLDLRRNNIGPSSCRSLANFRCVQLKEIILKQNNIGPEGCFEIGKAKFPHLRVLNLRSTRVDSQGCRWLSHGSWPELNELNLRCNNVTSSGCEWLTRGNWPNLKKLNLSNNKCGDLACAELVKGRWGLQILEMKECMIEDRGCKWLSRGKWPSLLVLDLQENNFTNTGLKWLTKGNWRSLTTLGLQKNMILNQEGAAYLAQFKLPNLFSLSISMGQYALCNLQLLKRNFKNLSHLNIQRFGQKKDDYLYFDKLCGIILAGGVLNVKFEEGW